MLKQWVADDDEGIIGIVITHIRKRQSATHTICVFFLHKDIAQEIIAGRIRLSGVLGIAQDLIENLGNCFTILLVKVLLEDRSHCRIERVKNVTSEPDHIFESLFYDGDLRFDEVPSSTRIRSLRQERPSDAGCVRRMVERRGIDQ